MFAHRIATTSVVFALVAATLGGGIADEVRSGFRMGGSLLPRQTKDLQAFSGALGGAKAQPVCCAFSLLTQSNCILEPLATTTGCGHAHGPGAQARIA